MDTDIGHSQHYRKDCYQDPCPLAENVVRDDRVWTHLDTVIANSNRAFKAIDFEEYEFALMKRRALRTRA